MRKTSPALTRRAFVKGVAATIAAPAVLRFGTGPSRAQTFGLVGDGKANDLPALRQMLAEAERRGKGVISLPAGRFRLEPEDKKPAVVLPANVRLQGAGRDQTTLVMADGAFGHVVSAPYGWAQIADLTIDGNEANRIGVVGHNLRLTGDQILVERVRAINAVSYGIAIGQRRYARDVTIRDVEIVNAGADGIDIKNDLARTEKIRIEKVTVRGFGRPVAGLPPHLVGSAQDKRRNKAAVDLRGQCEVHDLTIIGILPDRDGLRFRNGEKGEGHGPGAHNAVASRIVVEGSSRTAAKAQGIAVVARHVRISDIDIRNVAIGITVGASDLNVSGGRIQDSQTAINAHPLAKNTPEHLQFRSLGFHDIDRMNFGGSHSAEFIECTFSLCNGQIQRALEQDKYITLHRCLFDPRCR